MVSDPNNLPDDPNELKCMIVAFLASDVEKQKTLDALIAEVSRLNATIQKLTEMLFGKKSEKWSKDQSREESNGESVGTGEGRTETADETKGAEPPEKTELKKPRKKKTKNGGGGRMKIPADLPVRIIEIHPPEEERTCAEFG
jgi:hypothetical protein